jgi:hypothetical protein
VVILIVAVDDVETETLSVLEVTAVGDAQVDDEVRVHVIADAEVTDGRMRELLLVPAGDPLICHAKDGLLPPPDIWAVIVSAPPEHILVLPEMVIVGATVELTVIVIALDVDVAGVTHVPDGVMTHVTTLPFASVLEV